MEDDTPNPKTEKLQKPLSVRKQRQATLDAAAVAIEEGNNLIEQSEPFFSEAMERLEELRDELQVEHEERSVKWQMSDAGEASQERLSALERAINVLEDCGVLPLDVDIESIEL
jgi:hypothetical protein